MNELKKTNLTITMDKEDRDELFRLVPSGEVSHFVYSLIKKELEKIKKEIVAEYRSAAEDQTLANQVKKWDISQLKKSYVEKKS